MTEGPKHPAAIDTQILIFALRTKFKDDDQKQLAARSRELLKMLHDTSTPIVLSLISVGEYLVGVEERRRAMVGQELVERFRIAPYNLRAAVVAAGLVPEAKKLVDGDRQLLMADCKIVGSIVTYPCKVFYTHDAKLRKLAEPVLNVHGLPPQLSLDLGDAK